MCTNCAPHKITTSLLSMSTTQFSPSRKDSVATSSSSSRFCNRNYHVGTHPHLHRQTHIYTDTPTQTHPHLHRQTHTDMPTPTQTHPHLHRQTHTDTPTPTQTHPHLHRHTHTDMPTPMQTHPHPHRHTHIYTDTPTTHVYRYTPKP